jgi:hypothetical protein
LNPNIILYAPTVEDIYDGKPLHNLLIGLKTKWKANQTWTFDGGTIVKRL